MILGRTTALWIAAAGAVIPILAIALHWDTTTIALISAAISAFILLLAGTSLTPTSSPRLDTGTVVNANTGTPTVVQ